MYLSIVCNYELFGELLEHSDVGRNDCIIARAHELWERLPEVGSSLLEMVMGHLREEMMNLMGADVVDPLMNQAVMTVDGAKLAFHEVPVVV